MRRVTLICCGLVLGLATPAHGAGGPVPPMQGGAGVSAPGGPDSYVAVWGGSGRTVVTQLRRSDSSVQRSRVLHANFGVPGATYDGIDTGLSADGQTLVLAEIMRRYPPKASRFMVLDAPRLKIRYRISLPGYFGVDAISPDGRWLYLIHYKDSGGANYDVRAYDVLRGRLLARAIVDPREPDEKMQGIPMTRVQSPDGRWAYTLYAADQPFIHALDTVGRTAVCIDVPQALANAPGEAKLTLHGGTLTIAQRGAPVATVDLRSYKVRPAASAPPARPRATATSTPASASAGGGVPWIVWLVPLAAFAVLAGVLRRRHATAERAPAPPEEIVVTHRHDDARV